MKDKNWKEKVKKKKKDMKKEYVERWFKDCHTHEVILTGDNLEGAYQGC